MREMKEWLEVNAAKYSSRTLIGKAIGYAYTRWDVMMRILDDGRLLPDNNLAENEIRPITLGRKNYLFCGNHDAAEDAAVIYSLMGCCKAADVDFKQWMNYFLNHVHEYDSDYSKDLVNLLPHSLKEQGVI